MKQYYNPAQTPLAFHKFMWYVSLPLAFFTLLGQMSSEFSTIEQWSWLYYVDFVHYIAALLLVITSFSGFFKWKSYAWYALLTYLGLQVGYCLLSVLVYASYHSEFIFYPISQLAAMLIYAIPVAIYYLKRRLLFFPEKIPLEYYAVPVPTNVDPRGGTGFSMPPIRFCRKCGSQLVEGNDFCGRCGTAIVKE